MTYAARSPSSLATSAFYAGILVTSAHAEMHLRACDVGDRPARYDHGGHPARAPPSTSCRSPACRRRSRRSWTSGPPTARRRRRPRRSSPRPRRPPRARARRPRRTRSPAARRTPTTGPAARSSRARRRARPRPRTRPRRRRTTHADEDANKASGGANTESLAGKVATPTPTPTPVPDSQVDPPLAGRPDVLARRAGRRQGRRPELLHRQVPDPAVPAADLPGGRHRVRHPLGSPRRHQRDRDGLRPQPERSPRAPGAEGWMQFMPATWKAYGVDGQQGRPRRSVQPG